MARESSDKSGQAQLSPEQCAVLRQIAQGHSTDEVAAALGLESAQVRQALGTTLQQLGARTKLEAILCAVERGLLTFEPQDDGGQ
jgi:DNA-binding NarL/FixJ family response regulator